jgi:bacteriocin biosynthesis cyclodehydratase domain-containing protein
VTVIPQLPLLAPWYRLVGDGDRLLLEHGQSVVVLEGGAARAFLPALLPLLDGTRTYDDLVGRLGVAARPALDLALELLSSHGLLVEGPDATVDVRASAHAVAAAYDLAPSAAAVRLGHAVVTVVGSGPAAVEVARLLRSAGVGEVRPGRWRGRGRADLAIVAPAADELDEVERWNQAALESGTSWLPIRPYDGRFAGVGPLIVPGESCCYECVLRRRSANVEYGEYLREIECAPLAVRADAAFDALVVALAAHLALRWIGGRDPALPGVLYAVEARPVVTVAAHPVLRVPRCPVCSPVDRLAPRLPWHGAEAA